MIDLQKLLASDLSKANQETLLQAVIDAEATVARARTWSGRLIAELRRNHNISWPQLEKLTGVSKGTLIRRAQPYL